MIRSTEQQLSEEDAQLIEANDLGSPFAIFKINPMYISFMYFLFFLLVIFFLICASSGLIYVIGPNWQGSDIDYLSLALVAVMIASCLFGVIFILRVALPEAQKQGKNDRGRKRLLNVVGLDNHLISELTGLTTQTTNIVLTDPPGSVIATFSTTAGSAALSGNQAYGPYGHLRYNAGGLSGMATSKGFSGQYSDAFSGLDYYNARYYQPAVGVFLSADSKEGNQQGMNPYMYVGGNPQTYNDPTGEYYAPPPQGNGGPPPTCEQISTCWSGSGGSGQPPARGTNPPPTRPTSDSPGTSNRPKCSTVCLSNGHRWLDFLGKVVMLLGGGAALVQTIGDLIKWVGIGIASLLQQGWAMVVD